MDLFDFYTWSQRKLVVHGTAVEINCACEELVPHLDHLVQPFREVSFPDGFVPLRGVIEPFDLEDVMLNLPARARPVPVDGQAFELFRDGDRYFRLDNSVGLTMVDLVRKRWQCWLTPEALQGDPVLLSDAAFLWPLAQLTAPRELHLLPAVAAAKDGFGVLLLGELPLGPELSTLLADGYSIIGQRWVALREEEPGKIAMLHLPGHVLQKPVPLGPSRFTGTSHEMKMATAAYTTNRLRDQKQQDFPAAIEQWTDLHASRPKSVQNHAFCDLILVCGLGRREQVRVKQAGWMSAMNVLRRSWPSIDLPPSRRGGKLVAKMASRVRVVEMQLSRDPSDLIKVLDLYRRLPAPDHISPTKVPANSRMAINKPPVYRPMKQSA